MNRRTFLKGVAGLLVPAALVSGLPIPTVWTADSHAAVLKYRSEIVARGYTNVGFHQYGNRLVGHWQHPDDGGLIYLDEPRI